MFIAGVRKMDRVRGDGWLDCPNCHEHAAQDVVDEMRFASLSFYRFTPVARSRILRCRRCGFRREATAEEMSKLGTAGKRVGRAWLLPIGLTPFIVAALVVLSIALRNSAASSSGQSYATVSASPIAPVTLQIPPGYNHSGIPPDTAGSPGLYTASSGTFILKLRRYPDVMTPADTLAKHFDDEVGLNAGDFPSKPPAATTVKVAGQDAQHVTIKYLQQGGTAVLDIYTFNHGGVSYMLDFLYLGSQGQAEADTNLQHIVDSLTFTGSETPFPSTASPGASSSSSSATSSGSSSASPSASPTH